MTSCFNKTNGAAIRCQFHFSVVTLLTIPGIPKAFVVSLKEKALLNLFP